LIEPGCDIDKIDIDKTPFTDEQKDSLWNMYRVVIYKTKD